MRRVISNFSGKLSNNSHSSFVPHSQHQKPFTSLSKPSYTDCNQKNCIFRCSQRYPVHNFYSCRSPYTFSRKVHGFLSNPLLPRQFMSTLSNTQFRILSKKLIDFKVGFSSDRFGRRLSRFNSSFGSNGRSWKSWFYRLSPDDMVLGLILANAAVFILWRIADENFMVKNFMISLDNFKSGRLHTLITSAFSHADVEHIISNMIGLYFFGINISITFGPEYLLKLYLAGAIAGSVFYLVHKSFLALSTKGQKMWNDPSRTPGLGASGAVNAIILLEIFLYPRATLFLDFIIPVPAILLGIFLIGKDVLRIIEGNSNISGSAHLGGAAVAAIAYFRIKRGRF